MLYPLFLILSYVVFFIIMCALLYNKVDLLFMLTTASFISYLVLLVIISLNIQSLNKNNSGSVKLITDIARIIFYVIVITDIVIIITTSIYRNVPCIPFC